MNVLVSSAAALLRVVRPSGALAGGLVGTIVLGLGGWGAYALLWAFFAGGTLATRFGRKRKEAMGKAEEAGGRRGAANVLANCSVAAFLVACAALTPASSAPLLLAAAAAFATALMDTVGTEVGQALRTPTVLLPDFRRVPPGTDGAVSIGGTLAGLLAALLLAALGSRLGLYPLSGIPVVVAAAFFGTIVESPCAACKGKGSVVRAKPLTVNIPPGVTDGGKLRFAGKGEPGTGGGPAGDLYVITHIKPHAYFTRDGADVLLDLPVTIAEAALGTEVTVPTPDGSKVKLKVAAGTADGKVLRVPGKGAPKLKGKGNGDLKVRVKIAVPTKLTSEQKELLRRFESSRDEDVRAHIA